MISTCSKPRDGKCQLKSLSVFTATSLPRLRAFRGAASALLRARTPSRSQRNRATAPREGQQRQSRRSARKPEQGHLQVYAHHQKERRALTRRAPQRRQKTRFPQQQEGLRRVLKTGPGAKAQCTQKLFVLHLAFSLQATPHISCLQPAV